MLGNTHIAIGLLSAIGAKELADAPIGAPEVLLTVLGSLLPDIDEPASIIARPGSLMFLFLPRPLRKLLDFVVKIFSVVINTIFSHRGITHWPLVPILLCGVALEIDSLRLLMFSVGYLSHLAADFCTPQGIPLYAPLRLKNYSGLRFPSGGLIERAFAILLWLFLLYYFVAFVAPTLVGPGTGGVPGRIHVLSQRLRSLTL